MDFRDVLVDYGFTQDEIEYICSKTNTRGVERAQKTLRDYETELGLSQNELRKLVVAAPGILGFVVVSENENDAEDTSVRSKIADYSQILNLSKTEVVKIIKKFPQYLGLDTKSTDPTSVKSKIVSIQNLLGFDEKEVLRFIKNYPQILSHSMQLSSPSALEAKVGSYAKILNVSTDTIVKMVRKLPQLLTLDINSTSNGDKSMLEFFWTTTTSALRSKSNSISLSSTNSAVNGVA